MIPSLLLAAFAVLLSWVYATVRQKRSRFPTFPQLPSSFLLGHLRAFDQAIRSGIPDRHPDHVFVELHEKLGRPPVILLDLWPVREPLLVVCEHEIAEQISRISNLFPWSLPKANTSTHLVDLLGPNNMLGLEGHEWKQTRRKFNYGFSHQNLATFIPTILEKASKFVQRLDRYASKQEEFSLVKNLTNLTFDVIGAVVMDVDLNAQSLDESEQGELVNLHLQLIESFTGAHAESPKWLIPRTTRMRRRLGKRINKLIDDIILQTQKKLEEDPEYASKSILATRLRNHDLVSGPEIHNETRDQIKIFLVGGHDTTSILLSYAFYELARLPRVLAALRAELDEAFGPETDPAAVRKRLLAPDGEAVLRSLRYLSAVIKETLRLWPPAGTGRMTKPGTNFYVKSDRTGQEYLVDGCLVYNCCAVIQRDESVYGESAREFVPERWLDAAGKSIPPSAWRPFERGPRNCIGQDLANLEAGVVIALVARRYDFVKVGLGAFVLDEKGTPVIGHDGKVEATEGMYSILQITAKPADGMMMKVKVAERK